MEFFGMGPLEIFVILAVALVVFGPDKLPHIAKNLGKGMRAFRKVTLDLTSEVAKEFDEITKEEEKASKQKEQEKDETNNDPIKKNRKKAR